MKVASYLDILSQLRLCTGEPLGTSVLQRLYQMKDNGHISLKVKQLNLVCQKANDCDQKWHNHRPKPIHGTARKRRRSISGSHATTKTQLKLSNPLFLNQRKISEYSPKKPYLQTIAFIGQLLIAHRGVPPVPALEPRMISLGELNLQKKKINTCILKVYENTSP